MNLIKLKGSNGSIFFPVAIIKLERIGPVQALVPARPQRIVAGGGVFSEDGRGRAWTPNPSLIVLICLEEKDASPDDLPPGKEDAFAKKCLF